MKRNSRRYGAQIGFLRALPICVLGILVSILSSVPASAQIRDSSLSLVPDSITQRFMSKHLGSQLQFGKTGYVKRASGTLSGRLKDRDPAQVVLEFLTGEKRLFGMTEPSEEFLLIRDGGKDPKTATRYLRFQQLYNGLRVYGGSVTAHFGRGDRLTRVGGAYFPDIDVPTVPRVSPEALEAIVARDVSPSLRKRSGHLVQGEPELIIYPRDGNYYLAWHVFVAYWGEYYIDALSGAIIWKQPNPRIDAPTPDRSAPDSSNDSL